MVQRCRHLQWVPGAVSLALRLITGRSSFARITVQQYEGESTNKWDMTKLPWLGGSWPDLVVDDGWVRW